MKNRNMEKIEVTNEPFVQDLLKEQRATQMERQILEAITGHKVSEALEVLATVIMKIAKQT